MPRKNIMWRRQKQIEGYGDFDEGDKRQKDGVWHQFNRSFAVNDNLSGIYLWLLFALLSGYINCDLRRYLEDSPLLLHLLGIYCFFFLFTSLDENNESGLIVTWIKTFLVYILFIMTTKTKWYFVIIILGLLLFDRSYKYYIQQNESNWSPDVFEERKNLQQQINFWVTVLIVVVIIIGSSHYMWLNKQRYKDKFSFYTFFIGKGKCSLRKKAE